MTLDRRGFVRTGATLAAGMLGAPLLDACRLESRRDLADQGFVHLRDDYFRRHLLLNPVTSTYLGGDGWDAALAGLGGRLRDYSDAGLREEARVYGELERARVSIDPGLLTPQHKVDHAVMGAQLGFLVWQLDRAYHQRSVDTYVAEPFRGIDWQIQQMRDFGNGKLGDDGEWRLVIARLSAIPEYVRVARANIDAGVRAGNMPDRRMVQRDGIDGSRSNATYFRTTLPALARGYLGDQTFASSTLSAVAGAGEAAARAYEEFGRWLAQRFARDTADRYALGEAGYQWRVRTIFRDERSASELFEYGARQVEEYTQRIADAAERIARERGISLPFADNQERAWSIRRVMEDLSADSPSNDDELLDWYRQTGARAVAYGRDHGLFDVPADYKLDVVPTPPVLRSTIEAAYYPAPPFKKSGVGRFYLTPTGNDPAALREQSRASVADTAVHEGFPGHDWHFKYMTQHADEISNIRWLTPGAVEDSSSMWSDSMATEGWGLYAEELMAEPAPDHPSGFYSAGEYLYELQGQLLRAARVYIDVGLHTGRLTYDAAVDYFTEKVSFYPGACARARSEPAAAAVCESAQRAIYRYSKWPTQAITYNLGKNAIIALRDAYRSRKGAAYSARDFHERFMRMGTIPANYFRELFLT
ncbi:MAG TPA: DUF885 domain-containing protein [Gemmatimonadaceae bacterium]|nr:DUF885 domain-containing protein [Gemmatimonadaceae bacterium]